MRACVRVFVCVRTLTYLAGREEQRQAQLRHRPNLPRPRRRRARRARPAGRAGGCAGGGGLVRLGPEEEAVEEAEELLETEAA